MPSAHHSEGSSRVPTLAERLQQARRHQFVGRASEIAGFAAALNTAELPYLLLHIHGPGGVGKTTLMAELERVAQNQNIPVLRLDARNVEASPDGFLLAVSLTLGLTPGTTPDISPTEVFNARGPRQVLMIDTYEQLQPLDGWLREVFLPQLTAETVVVLAGRRPPSISWRTDPGWANLIRPLALRNLQASEGREYLARRGVPADQFDAVMAFTHGHPLALSLVADTFNQRTAHHSFDIGKNLEPDVVKTLLERFLEQVPGPAHRAALEACALVRLTTETLLATMMDVPDANELFEWLRGLSFIESKPVGLFPHDLARDAICYDLRWRNPDWNRELHRRARAYYTERLQRTRGLEQQRILMDDVYLHRENPMVKPFLSWGEFGSVYGETARPDDHTALLDMVRQHQGETEARIASHWFSRQPHNLIVYRDSSREPAGLLFKIDLHEATPEDLRLDPFAAQALGFAQRPSLSGHGPVREGESVILFRFWMAREGFQSVTPTQSLIFINAVQQYFSAPRLAWSFFPVAQPEFWSPALTYMDLMPVPVAHDILDAPNAAQHHGVFGHDWRVMGIPAWLEMLGEREMATEPLETVIPPSQAAPVAVLSQPEFEEAVRNALREFNRPTQLGRNALVHSRLVSERGGTPNAQGLRRVIIEAAQGMTLNPRDEKLYKALEATYFEPAQTQELAAERLDLPFSTYRRHLTTGVTRLTETLWTWELHG
jgi:hypothetical protein